MTGGVPTEFPGVTPQLTVPDTDTAVRFYHEVFGADELLRNHGPDGRVMHCELLVNGGRLLLHDEFPDNGHRSPRSLGGTPVTLHLYVADVDESFTTAVAGGAEPLMPPTDTFWGDRYAIVRDPFGHRWSLATQHEDLSTAELQERADRWAGDHGEVAHEH
jgi:PhnB protein